MNRRLAGAFVVALLSVAVVSLPTLKDVPGCIRAAIWPTELIALHTAADGLIAVAYTWIPITLIIVWRARKDIPVNWTLLCFAAFIVLCGLTHVMGIVTVWRPLYWLSGEVKAVTAIISITTAALLTFRVYPILLSIPSASELRSAMERAEREAGAAREATTRAEAVQAELAEANTKLAAVNEGLATRAGALTVSNEELSQQTRELRDALEKVKQQEIAIRELSTPVLELEDGVLLVPLIGTLDSERASRLMEIIGAEIAARRAQSILLDLTGVPVIDTAVASALIKTAGMVNLLGARCVATGLQPAVARTLVELGVDIAIPTRGSLAQGLRYLIRMRERAAS